MIRLRVETGEPKGEVFELGEGENVLGRSRSVDIKLETPEVSRKHACITVVDGQATVESLSQYGAWLDDEPIEEPRVIRAGQRLKLRENMVLVVEDDQAPAARNTVAVDVSKTGEGDMPTGDGSDQPAASQDGANTGVEASSGVEGPGVPTGPMPSPMTSESPGVPTGTGESAGADEVKFPAATVDDSKELHIPEATDRQLSPDATRVMETRIAVPGELEEIRRTEAQRTRKRLMVMIGALALMIAAIAMLRPKAPDPEEVLTWPRDASGGYLVDRIPGPSGGYRLGYPNSENAKVTDEGDGNITVECRIGRDRDVPFLMMLTEQRDDRFLTTDMTTIMDEWRTAVSGAEDTWLFDAPVKMALFYGYDNGIPFQSQPYQREADQRWVGVAAFFRHGRLLVILRTEIPAEESTRGEGFIYQRFFDMETEFVHTHWEGGAKMPSANAVTLLEQARSDMRRNVPATWTRTEGIIRAAIHKAAVEGDAGVEHEGIQLLSKVRERQARWFHGRWLEFKSATQQGNEEQTQRIAGLSKAVFSEEADRRFHVVRKW